MEKTDIDPFVSSFVDTILNTMKGTILGGEEVAPAIFLLGREGENPSIIPLLGLENLFMSKEGKRELRGIIKKVWEKFSGEHRGVKLVAVVIFSDSWVESIPIEEWEEMGRKRDGSSLADKPGMGEAIVAQCSLVDYDVTFSLHYVRGEKDIVFASQVKTMRSPSNSRAFLMGLWPL